MREQMESASQEMKTDLADAQRELLHEQQRIKAMIEAFKRPKPAHAQLKAAGAPSRGAALVSA